MARDRLLLHGLRLFGRHGVLPAERTLGQPFMVSVDVHCDVSNAARTDNPDDTEDYVRVFDVARRVIEGPPRNLVETVATDIARNVLDNMPTASAVRVRVTKPHVALPAVLDGVGVDIFRERTDFVHSKP